MSSKNKEAKVALVNELASKLDKVVSFVVIDYKGVTVEQDVSLRKSLRENKIEYKVLKNTLMLRALNNKGIKNFDEVLKGPSAFAFSYDCPVSATRIIAQKNNEFADKLIFKAGLIEGKFFDKDGLTEVSKIPSKDTLLAQLVGLLTNPIRSLAIALNEVAKKQS